jgi:hypothetical protein
MEIRATASACQTISLSTLVPISSCRRTPVPYETKDQVGVSHASCPRLPAALSAMVYGSNKERVSWIASWNSADKSAYVPDPRRHLVAIPAQIVPRWNGKNSMHIVSIAVPCIQDVDA